MRLAVVCNDTRGGVEPYFSLSRGLVSEGHEVTIIAPDLFRPSEDETNLGFVGLSGDAKADLTAFTGPQVGGPISTMRRMARRLPERLMTWTRETLDGCEGAQLVLGGVGGMATGVSVAERLGIGFLECHLQPLAYSPHHPGVLFPSIPSLLGVGIAVSHALTAGASWWPFQLAMRQARDHVLGLSGLAMRPRGLPRLFGFSPKVVPMGPSHTNIATGYWFDHAATFVPSRELHEFLTLPGPVISVGFGSMPNQDPVASAQLICDAAIQVGVRVVLLGGWGGLASRPSNSNVLWLESAPHAWLFPRVAAAVHHGGAGTTGAAFRAGIPQIVLPFAVDQPFWGQRVYRLGVGPAPVAQRDVDVDVLARSIEAALKPSMVEKAEHLGLQVSAEDGVKRAVEVISGVTH